MDEIYEMVMEELGIDDPLEDETCVVVKNEIVHQKQAYTVLHIGSVIDCVTFIEKETDQYSPDEVGLCSMKEFKEHVDDIQYM